MEMETQNKSKLFSCLGGGAHSQALAASGRHARARAMRSLAQRSAHEPVSRG